ncbi:Threonine dehydratase biosynthetic, chloroplastic [Asimina triloba]
MQLRLTQQCRLWMQAVSDAETSFDLSIAKHNEEKKRIIHLEEKLLENENALHFTMEEIGKLKEEKEMVYKKHVELVCTELNSLRDQAKQQEALLVEAKRESQLINGRLDEALEKIGFYEEKRKTMQSISASVHELLTGMADFECKAMGNITNNFLRLEMLNQQYRMLVQLANTFKRKELTYKERLERQNSDLQMAEAEVDLLGDEVKIIGVEPFDANVMALSLYHGQRIMLEQVGGFADGAAVKVVGEETFRICRELVDGVILVSRDAICASIKDMFEEKRSILEPAGALALAGAEAYCKYYGLKGEAVVAITYGANMNFDRLRLVIELADVCRQREVVLATFMPEEKGSFTRFCELFCLVLETSSIAGKFVFDALSIGWKSMVFVVEETDDTFGAV